MREIYVVTHTEATHVTDKLVGGWFDSSLTARGRSDAELVAKNLARRLGASARDVEVVSSDLRRARRTAEVIARSLGAARPILDSDLRERSYGEAEGRPPGLTPFDPPPAHGDRLDHHPGTPGTETRREWSVRAYRAMQRVIEMDAERAVVVTHGGTLTYLVCAWIGLPPEHAGYAKVASTPGGITHLRLDPVTHDRELVALNEISYVR